MISVRTLSAVLRQPAIKRQRITQMVSAPQELGKLSLCDRIAADTELLQQVGWEKFVSKKQGRDDFSHLNHVSHHAHRLLRQYKHRGVPVMLSTHAWTQQHLRKALNRDSHRSCLKHIDFLEEAFLDIME